MSNNIDPTQLGSLNNFAQVSGLDPSTPEALSAYTERLKAQRQDIAARIGIGLDELHLKPLQDIEVDFAQAV